MGDSDGRTQITKKYINYREKCKKRHMALKSLCNYINQLKIHFDLNENDIIKILKQILKTKNNDNFIKSCGTYLFKKLK